MLAHVSTQTCSHVSPAPVVCSDLDPVSPGWGYMGRLCEQVGTLLCWGDARIKPPGQPRSRSPSNENKARSSCGCCGPNKITRGL